MARRVVDIIQHLFHQIVGKVAGVDAGEPSGGILRRAAALTRRERDQLQRGRPARDIVAQASALLGGERRAQPTVKNCFAS